jgi:hypothetical protein
MPAKPWPPKAAVAAVIGWWLADLDRAAVQLSAAVTAWTTEDVMCGISEPEVLMAADGDPQLLSLTTLPTEVGKLLLGDGFEA